MKIHGFNKTTLLDYPEHLAATIFTGGCNFRCPFCHNGGLVLDPDSQPAIPEEEVLQFLKKRRGILEGVCITGGEPTLQPDLAEFIGKIKEMGYLVKLDTNGSGPEVLKELLEKGLLDYVAMDIKASKENYARAAGLERCLLSRIEESVEILKSGLIPYEFRTTVVKGIHMVEEFDAIGQWLAGCRAYYLQAYRENDNILAYSENGKSNQVVMGLFESAEPEGSGANRAALCALSDFARTDMEIMADKARKYIDKVELRGVE